MTGSDKFAEILNLIVAIGFLALLIAVGRKITQRKWSEDRSVADEPNGTPYKVYTREYDRELPALAVKRDLLGASPDLGRGWLQLSTDAWEIRLAAAKTMLDDQRAAVHAVSKSFEAHRGAFAGSAVSLLVDQSGSMRGRPMMCAAATSRVFAEVFASLGARVEVLGFSTAGWRGGYAYRRWKTSGQPKRPGRLCALLHIVYKSADEAVFGDEQWHAMLNPNILRENVDGEALEWAIGRLNQRPEVRRVLIVISDGAPVDDVTLLHNGPSYLERHLKTVIGKAEADPGLAIGAIGIGYGVDRYYPISSVVIDAEHLLRALRELLPKLAMRIDRIAVVSEHAGIDQPHDAVS